MNHIVNRHEENVGTEDDVVHNDTDDENSDSFHKYFEKSQLSSRFATCVRCKKLYRNDAGSLQTHLKSCQGVEKGRNPQKSQGENDGGIETQQTDKSTGSVDKQKTSLTSFVWRHFTRSPNSQSALCKYCKKWFKTPGGTSNLNRHLMRCHRAALEDSEMEEEEEEVKLERAKADGEISTGDNYISEEDLKKAKESAGAEGLDDYVILVVR